MCTYQHGKSHKKSHPRSVTKLITGQTCFRLIDPTLALSRTMSAFVL